MIPDWFSDASGSSTPNNTTQVRNLMDDGKYQVELYAYIDCTKQLDIRINQPAYTTFAMCVFNNFTLTRIDTESGGQTNGFTDLGYSNPEANVYNLQGQRISMPTGASAPSALPKGVYIVGGKKLIVR